MGAKLTVRVFPENGFMHMFNLLDSAINSDRSSYFFVNYVKGVLCQLFKSCSMKLYPIF